MLPLLQFFAKRLAFDVLYFVGAVGVVNGHFCFSAYAGEFFDGCRVSDVFVST